MFLFQRYLLVPAFFILCFKACKINAIIHNRAFDHDLYESVIDPEECQKQLTYLGNNTNVRNRFIDASWRIPRSLLRGNLKDYGNYFQCLGISELTEDMHIGGKYISLNFPVDDLDITRFPPNITLPDFDGPDGGWPDITWPDFNPSTTILTKLVKKGLGKYEQLTQNVRNIFAGGEEDTESEGDDDDDEGGFSMNLRLAVCIPKVCTAREALDSFTDNMTQSLNFTEEFVRLPNDKPWAPADTVAMVILSIIGLITILSTAYDIRHTIFHERDPKKANKIYQSFSVYTNTRNFFIFTDNPSAVTCLEGVRSIAMIWVIVGHTFVTQTIFGPENPLDIFNFIREFSSLWITSAPITVDTFFMISGLLVVYTTAAKVSRMSLIRNLHLFYLNRLLRMFPILAFGVLMMSSFLYRLADGPHFYMMTAWVDNCRDYWWSTLLYIQNFHNPLNMCLPHTWYLAIDMQLHLFAPVVLFFVLGQRKWSAWSAIVGTLLVVVTAATIYNFMNNFQSATISLARNESNFFLQWYYIHTLPRAAPFFVGMIFGYLLHLCRGRRVSIPMPFVLCLWVLSLSGIFAVISVTYWNIQPDWDNQLMDNLLNSFKRPIWAACVGWIIFGCAKGFGGPINWFLSLHIFKILGRLSYAMYILHYPLIYLINSTALAPIYFAWSFSIHRFFIDLSLAVIAAFCVTILIDSPFANLIKMAIGTGPKKRPVPKEKPSLSSGESQSDFQSVDVTDVTDDDLKNTKM